MLVCAAPSIVILESALALIRDRKTLKDAFVTIPDRSRATFRDDEIYRSAA
jgi:hypothetical protein